MSNGNAKAEQLREVLVHLSDGGLSESDAQRLNDLLRGDPEACELYLNHVALEAQLQREFGGAPAELAPGFPPAPAHSEAARKVVAFPMWLRYAAAAALAVCATWLAMVWRGGGDKTVAVSEAWIATVLLAEDCEWMQPRALHEGQRLAAGALRLARGTAVLRFDGGAELVLRGETELDLQSATQAKLLSGDVTVRAPDEAAGFKLHTPASELTDLGTEFAVKVDRSGATELHVLEGEVAYAPDAKTTGTVLNAGKALRFDRANATPHPVSLDAPRFDELVKQANPRERPDLMTAYDGFFYDEGAYAPAQLVKGKGWAGPWRLRTPDEWNGPGESDTTTDMRIVHGKLSVPWPVPGGRLGMLEMPPGKFYRIRQMAQPIAMDRDGITYFSLMTQEPDHSARISNSRPQEGVRLTFRASADYRGESLSFGLGNRLRPRIQAYPQGEFNCLASVPDEQSLLWIGKIIRRADGEDEITFRIYGQNDPLDYAEPATWHVATRGVRQNAKLDLVVLSSTGASIRIVDELRIGPTWRSVVPIQTPFAQAR
jgi:hypothetical protein